MTIGKINSALRTLNQTDNAGVLPINEETVSLINDEYPIAEPIDESIILQGPTNYVDNIVFEKTNGSLLKNISFNMKGAAGPSGMDTDKWRMTLGTNNVDKRGKIWRIQLQE